MKRLIGLLLSAAFLFLSGCSRTPTVILEPEQKRFTATYLNLFDTVTTIVGFAESEEAFQAKMQIIHDELEEYHRLFDIYNEYDGINNLKIVNDNAGIKPVKVDSRIIEFLLDCKDYYEATDGKVNAAMGSVLYLWHVARNDSFDDPLNAYLPDTEELAEAALHTSFEDILINEQASTVYLADPDMRLDVGAIAKGWSVQRVCDTIEEGMLVSVGGNVCATGPKDQKGTPWSVGIVDPAGQKEYLHTVNVSKGCVVTSGDYQRNFAVDGELYHHIIDPETLFPSEYWRSVTIVCRDSGDADALSTALFLLPQSEGQQLLSSFDAEAMWVDRNGTIFYSPGFRALIRT